MIRNSPRPRTGTAKPLIRAKDVAGGPADIGDAMRSALQRRSGSRANLNFNLTRLSTPIAPLAGPDEGLLNEY